MLARSFHSLSRTLAREQVHLSNQMRLFSRYDIHFDEEMQWPISFPNTIINVCPQGENMIIERLGKLHTIVDSGFFFAIPLVDNIKYRVDMREKAFEIPPQAAITRDNVSVMVSGNLYVQFVDPAKAAYGSQNPLYSVVQHAQSSMRSAIGELELDEILHARSKLNFIIHAALEKAASAWGMDVKRYELTEITPDHVIMQAMDKQAAAERNRREKVLNAEGSKRAMELESEGHKERLRNESEGELIRIVNESEAQKKQIILEAEGVAESILLKAEATAKGLEKISEVLKTKEGMTAAQLQVAKDYIGMYGEMGQKSNTMIFSDRPGDVNSLLAQASAVIKNTLNQDPATEEAK